MLQELDLLPITRQKPRFPRSDKPGSMDGEAACMASRESLQLLTDTDINLKSALALTVSGRPALLSIPAGYETWLRESGASGPPDGKLGVHTLCATTVPFPMRL